MKKIISLINSMIYARHELLVVLSIIKFGLLFIFSCLTLFIYNIVYCIIIIYYKKTLKSNASIPLFSSVNSVFLEIKNTLKHIDDTEEIRITKDSPTELIIEHNIPKFKIYGIWSFTENIQTDSINIAAEVKINRILLAVIVSFVGRKIFVDYYAYIVLKSTQETIDITFYNFIKAIAINAFNNTLRRFFSR